MRVKTSLREWQNRYKTGYFDNPERSIQIQAGWYDWFCKEEELANRTKTISELLLKLRDSKKVSLDKHFAWFMNRCTAGGILFDDIKISDIDSGKVLYEIVHNEPYDEESPLWKVYAICEGIISKNEDEMEFNTYSFTSTDELTEWLNK